MASTKQIKIMVMVMKVLMLSLIMSSHDLEYSKTYTHDQIESASKKAFSNF